MAKTVKFLTKNVVLITLVAVLALGGVIWLIVANLQPNFNSGINLPAEYRAINVSGNGTSAVMVDDYLYFVGDYIETAEIGYSDNNYYSDGKMNQYGIYRVKIADLMHNGKNKEKEILDYEYNNTYYDEENNVEAEYQPEDEANYNLMKNVTKINDWDNIGKKDCKINAVVPKIAGHDNASMWVFGRYLVYATPNNQKDPEGNLRTSYLDFYRVDLDGKNHTLLYSSTNPDLKVSNHDFTVWGSDFDNIYLLVNDGGTINKINVVTKAQTQIATDVTKAVFPTVVQYRRNSQNERLVDVFGGVMSYVYYTKARGEDEQTTNDSNLMYRCNIVDSANPELIGDRNTDTSGTVFTPMAVTPMMNGNAQFVYKTEEKIGNAPDAIVNYHVATNDLANFSKTSFENLPGENFGLTESIDFYANGFYVSGGTLYQYQVTPNNEFNYKKQGTINELLQNVDSVIAVSGNVIYVQKGINIVAVDPNGVNHSVVLQTASTTVTTDDEESDEDNTYKLCLPASILLASYDDDQNGNEVGRPLVFAHDTDSIRLFTTDGNKFAYLKLKPKIEEN